MAPTTEYGRGNIALPGYGPTRTAPADPEVLFSMQGLVQKGGTVKAGQGVLLAGTVLAVETSSKKFVVYNNGGSGGTDTAKAVLRHTVDTSNGDVLGNMIYAGSVKLSVLSGLDSGAITDLNGRSDNHRDLFQF